MIFRALLLVTVCFSSLLATRAVEMEGRVAFSGGVGGRIEHYPIRLFYGGSYIQRDDTYAYYYPEHDCDTYEETCLNRGGIIRFWGATGLESNGGKKAELLGGSLSMERFGSRNNTFGKYTGRIFAVFRLDDKEFVRWGTVAVRLRKKVLRTPFGRLKLARRVHDYELGNRQFFRGHGRIQVNVTAS